MGSLSDWSNNFKIKQQLAEIRSNHRRRADFYDILSSYSSAFPSLVDILVRIGSRKKEDGESDYLLFETILNSIQYSNTNALDALGEFLPKDEIVLISSASKKGQIQNGFVRAKFVAEKKAEAKSAIISSLAYPTYMVGTTVMLLWFILSNITPDLLKMLPLEQWPSWTKFLHTLYQVIVVNTLYTFMALAGFVAVISFSMKIGASGFRDFLNKLPPWSIHNKIQSSVFLISLGELINNGESFPKAINQLALNSNSYTASYIEIMEESIKSNRQTSEVLDSKMFNRNIAGMLKDFSFLKNFGDKTISIGEKQINSTVGSIKAISLGLGLIGVICAAATNGYISLASHAIQNSFIS